MIYKKMIFLLLCSFCFSATSADEGVDIEKRIMTSKEIMDHANKLNLELSLELEHK
jgi:hypothetical protein